MKRNKKVDANEIRLVLLLLQIILWLIAIVVEIAVIIVKHIDVSNHAFFLISVNIIPIFSMIYTFFTIEKRKKKMRGIC